MIDFIAQTAIQKEGSEENELTKSFVTAKRLLKQSKLESAFKLLSTVEREALELENFTLDGEVYSTLLALLNPTEPTNA